MLLAEGCTHTHHMSEHITHIMSSYLASAFHLWKKSSEERVVASKYLDMGMGNLRTKI